MFFFFQIFHVIIIVVVVGVDQIVGIRIVQIRLVVNDGNAPVFLRFFRMIFFRLTTKQNI